MKRMRKLTLVAILASFLCHVDTTYVHTDAKALRASIFSSSNYDPVTRPSDVTNIKMAFHIRSIEGLEWTDARLAWTPSSNGNIEYVFAKPSEIWKPELVVDNSVLSVGVIADDELHLRVHYSGLVTWEPPRIFHTHCEIDITFYPFDRQKCELEMASWGYHKSEVTLEHLETHVSLEDYKENGEWEVTGTSVSTSDLVETLHGSTFYYPQLHFQLALKRRPTYYILNTILPVVISSFLMVIVFILPADSGEKVSYALTVLLALAVLLTLIAEHMPSTSLTTSVLGLFIAFTLFLAAFSVLATVIILVYHHRDGHMTANSMAVKITRIVSALLCGSNAPSGTCVTKVVPAEEHADVQEEFVYSWKEAAEIWDRFCFWFFFLFTFLSTFVFMIALSVGGLLQTTDGH